MIYNVILNKCYKGVCGDFMEDLISVVTESSRYILPVIGAIILIYCTFTLLRHKFPSPEYAALINTKTNDVHELTFWEISVGRSNVCDIIIDADMSVSRFHAVIARRRKGWTLIDTYSKTGSFVNGRRIDKKTIIENGDTLTFGATTFRFQM